MKMSYKFLLATAGTLLSIGSAQAEVVDFEELDPNTTYASPLESGGLVFENDGFGTPEEAFFAIEPGSNGTLTLAPNFFGSTTTVSAVGGALFTLESFDFSDAFDFADDPVQVDFTFNTSGGVVTATYFADEEFGMQTQLVDISGISSFSFVTSGSLFLEDTIQTDNWVYTLDSTGPGGIPEPATWAMLIGGMGLAGGTMRRRNARTSVTFA